MNRDISVIEQRVVPEEFVRPVAELNRSFGLDTWVYRAADPYLVTQPVSGGCRGARRRAGRGRRAA